MPEIKGPPPQAVLTSFTELQTAYGSIRNLLFFLFRLDDLRPRGIGVLQFVKLPIQSTQSQQVLMCSLLSNLAAMQDDDVVGPLNRRETMSDDQRSAAAHDALDGLLN